MSGSMEKCWEKPSARRGDLAARVKSELYLGLGSMPGLMRRVLRRRDG